MPGQVLIERQLPLRWYRRTGADAPARHNALAFALLDVGDESHPAKGEAETHTELARIENKLNLVLQLVSQLLQQDKVLPPPQGVRFASDALAWPAGELQTGEPVILELFLESNAPVPVIVQGRVRAVEAGWAMLGLESLTEEQQASWSRWVFRQHRRDVARHRHG